MNDIEQEKLQALLKEMELALNSDFQCYCGSVLYLDLDLKGYIETIEELLKEKEQ